jgi:hypothetical protein
LEIFTVARARSNKPRNPSVKLSDFLVGYKKAIEEKWTATQLADHLGMSKQNVYARKQAAKKITNDDLPPLVSSGGRGRQPTNPDEIMKLHKEIVRAHRANKNS